MPLCRLTERQADRIVTAIKATTYLGLLGLFGWYCSKASKDYHAKKDTPIVSVTPTKVPSLVYPQLTACTPDSINPPFMMVSNWLYNNNGSNPTDVRYAAAAEPELSAAMGVFCASINSRGVLVAAGAGFNHRLEIGLYLNLGALTYPVYSSLRIVISEPGTKVTADMMQATWLTVSPGISSVSLTKSTLKDLKGATSTDYDLRVLPVATYRPANCSQSNPICAINGEVIVVLLSYGQMVVMDSSESPAATAEMLMGNISGMLSLLVGFSITMIIDIFGWVLKKLFVRVAAAEEGAGEGRRKSLSVSLDSKTEHVMHPIEPLDYPGGPANTPEPGPTGRQ